MERRDWSTATQAELDAEYARRDAAKRRMTDTFYRHFGYDPGWWMVFARNNWRIAGEKPTEQVRHSVRVWDRAMRLYFSR